MASQESLRQNWQLGELEDTNFQIHGRALFIVVVFSLILLVTLFYLYLRLCCPFRHHSPSASLSAHEPRPPQGLDQRTISKLPFKLHESSLNESEANECVICLGIFEDGETVRVLPECGHYYHAECVESWLKLHSSCPLCRAFLSVLVSLV